MKIKCDVGFNRSLLNTVRAASFSSLPVVRPIGFMVAGTSNVVSLPDTVLEDMTKFIANVSKGEFIYTGNEALIVCNASFTGELKLSELLAGTAIKAVEDFTILHATETISVKVLFRFDRGCYTLEQNRDFLEKHSASNCVVINSRHCPIKSFNVLDANTSAAKDTFEITIDTISGVDETEVWNESIDAIISTLSHLKR